MFLDSKLFCVLYYLISDKNDIGIVSHTWRMLKSAGSGPDERILFLTFKLNIQERGIFTFHLPMVLMVRYCWDSAIEEKVLNYFNMWKELDPDEFVDIDKHFMNRFFIPKSQLINLCNYELNKWS